MNALRVIGASLLILAYAIPISTTQASGAGTVLVSDSVTSSPNIQVDYNIVALTPTVVSEKQPTVNITIVESVYQQQQAALAAQQAAIAAAAAKVAAQKATQLAAEQTATQAVSSDTSQAVKLATVQKAAATFGINWKVLAAVWQVESGSQWVTSEQSYAGAVGPCQFLPSTWRSYAYDGDGNGTKNIDDASDCLFGAAKLLASNGATSGNNVSALLSYNHSMAYVDRVMAIANSFVG